jgi:hypothetical protein
LRYWHPLTPYSRTPTKLLLWRSHPPFEETRWESFESYKLVGIVWRNLHHVVASVWVYLDGVIPTYRLIQNLPDRMHFRFGQPQTYQAHRTLM